MALEVYKKKRNFSKSPEPKTGLKSKAGVLRFTFQRHETSHLHYDLRLEMGGVLKSWAIPKGPSMNPDDNRLAMMTEDHPLDYINFEGVIPKGNYGAGMVSLWDQGTYHAAEGNDEKQLLKDVKRGSLKIILNGEKLKGQFTLRKAWDEGENHWRLRKITDEYAIEEHYDAEERVDPLYKKSAADPVQLNKFVRPMLAKKVPQPFDNPDWIFELKWDGYRAIASNLGGRVQLYSRNGLSFNEKYLPVTDALQKIKASVILDGEIVTLGEDGTPVFNYLQNYQTNPQGELRYYIFDILHLNGKDTTGLPLTERKKLIPGVIGNIPHLWYCDHIEEKGKSFFNSVAEAGIEGIIAKKADSRYSPGARTDKWLKIKALERQEAIVCGYTEPQGSRKYFGSLLLGIYQDGKLRYAGSSGGGFNDRLLKDIHAQLQPLVTSKSPFNEKINLKGRKPTWVKPRLICEVAFTEWTPDGHMRHPIFKGLRSDKAPKEVSKEEEVKAPTTHKSKKDAGNQLEIDGHLVNVTGLEKVYWPDDGLRKYDMIEYYLAVADTILPYLKDRPQNLNRSPGGIEAKNFYQKNTADIMPEWVETIPVVSESSGKLKHYTICQNKAALIYLANIGCIELNPWHNRKQNLLMPDYTVVDLDPGDGNTFEEVIETVLAVKEVLDKGKVTSFCKTSGSSGLHIYIPLAAKYDYDQARDFAKVICLMVHSMLPKLTSMERDPMKRKNKIYLDYLQNRRSQTLAAPYCIRPKPGATVSAPLEWKEVKPGLNKADFNIRTMLKRLEKKGDLFKGILGEAIDMEACLERLA